ncbi:MAG: protein kinase domain-containing protein [Gammaproteobacteria bacterium]
MSAQSEDGPAQAVRPGTVVDPEGANSQDGTGTGTVGDVDAFTQSTFLPDEPSPPATGSAFDATLHTIRNLGRYGITEELGDGAMSRVYKAFDPRIQRFLAVKVLHEQQANEEEVRLRFLREAKAAGNLSHPNIVTVYDVGEVDGYPYMAMELLEGQTLDNLIRPGEKLPVEQVLAMSIQLADALDYAHARGIVHRDIKPSNIALLEDGRTVKITDFGIARMEDVEASERTKIGTVLGTPHYMSPEQIMGQRVDGRSDLFSVGVLMYQMLTGKRPFASDTQTSLFIRIATENPDPIESIEPEVPPALRKVAEKLLSKDAAQRYQSGAELAQALRLIQRAALEEADAEEFRPGVSFRLRWALVMAGIVALTMLAGLFVVTKRQAELMAEVAVDYGASLVNFIATETAESMLVGDWVALEVFVEETNARQGFNYLTLADRSGVVRGSTDPNLVGKKYIAPEGAIELPSVDRTRITERELSVDEKIFAFSTPVLFQNKSIGRVYLGMTQSPITRAVELSMLALGVLMGVTLMVVGVLAFAQGARVSRGLKIARRALSELKQGHFEYRIGSNRRDEFGVVYTAVDKLAESLLDAQHRESTEDMPIAEADLTMLNPPPPKTE